MRNGTPGYFLIFILKDGKLCRTGLSGNSPIDSGKNVKALYLILHPVSRREISILRLIYSDLAERIEKGKINLENFLLFFHKNGYWGERLFQEFDYDETNLLSED